MAFNSFAFLVFFPLVTGIYFMLAHRFRWMWLLLASCIFYMFFIPQYIIILFVTISIDYLAGIKIAQTTGKVKKRYLWLSIVSTILVLAIFKYAGFLSSNVSLLTHVLGFHKNLPVLNIVLPIGLSFHTFQSLSYVVEVYRGKQQPEKHFGIYALYVMFYPQLVAGPIERPQQMLHQFYEKHAFKYNQAASGLKLMAWGFFKKLVIADRLATIVNPVYSHPGHYTGAVLALATLLFAQQIYCDFSGYSDIAIGAARVMGFNLMKNFNTPYFSKSISEFWTRWHISLSTWFRDYVYIPLGGNRVVRWRWYYNIMVVFLLSGLWHGANWTYVIWGALNGVYLIAEAATKSWRKKILAALLPAWLISALGIFTTFILITLSWVFFRANTCADALLILSKIFSASLFSINYTSFINLYVLAPGLTLIAMLELIQAWHKKFNIAVFLSQKPVYFRFALYSLFIMAILNLGVFSSSGFIYFQF